jgi:SAM-dependent methyltransferase
MKNTKYVGNELGLFKDAVNWKNYWYNEVDKFISGDVLEVGAGIGVNTNLILLNNKNCKSILSLEPDKSLSDQILENLSGDVSKVTINCKYLNDIPEEMKFDTIVYIDVIEHIEDDCKELVKATSHLKEEGILIILVPAFNFLFSPFDKAVGHYRRYNKKMLSNAIPNELTNLKLFYLDSMGICASLLNKFVLKQPYPTKKQILRYDNVIIPISKLVDKLLFNSLGKSLVGIWKK